LKYPLLTQKKADFLLFKSIVELIINKDHLTIEGLNKIINIKAAINKGLSKELIEFFPNIIPVNRPIIVTSDIPDPNWISGFSSGESCFDVKTNKSIRYTAGYQIQIRFRITQHTRDRALLDLIASYLDCGSIQPSLNVVNFCVSNYKDVVNIIISFFNKYPIQGSKFFDFEDFCKVAELMENKAHLTIEGMEQIKEIKNKMNSLRTETSN